MNTAPSCTTSSSSSSSSSSSDASSTSSATQNGEELLIKQCAAKYLGCGYDRVSQGKDYTSRICERVLQDFNADIQQIIEVRDPGFYQETVLGSSLSQASKKLEKKILVCFGNFSKSNTASASIKKTNSSKKMTEKFVLASTFINFNKCAFNKVPSLKKGVRIDNPRIGDSVITSAWIYTGYKIFFTINTQSNEDDIQDDIQGNAKVSFFGLQLGASADSLSSILKKRKITGVSIIVEGFGNYQTPSFPIPEDLAKIPDFVARIKADYLSKIHTITQRSCYYDENFVEDYAQIDRQAEADFSQTHSSTSQPPPPSPGENRIKDFCALAKKIKENSDYLTPSELSLILEGVILDRMLESMNNVFSATFKHQPERHQFPGYFMMVIGATGVGKSAFIGYMSGAKLIPKTIEHDGGAISDVLVYEYGEANFPPIGHLGSETIGCKIYKKYIDTGGLFELRGIETDMCNAMAASIAVKTHKVNKITIVLSSAYFGDRAVGFLNTIKLLKRIVGVSINQNILSSVLFLINDKEQITSKRTIINRIKIAILERKNNLQEKMGFEQTGGLLNWFKTSLSGDGFFEVIRNKIDELEQISPQLAQEGAELLKEIEILEQLLVLEKNIIIADFSNNSVEHEIHAWEDETTGEPLPLVMENLVEGGSTQFVMILAVIANYFNGLFIKNSFLDDAIKQIDLDIFKKNNELEKLKKSFSIENPEKLNETNLKTIKNNNNDLTKAKTNLAEKTTEITEIIKKNSDLDSDKEIFYEELNVNVQPCSFWDIRIRMKMTKMGIMPDYQKRSGSKSYPFECNIGIPIADAKKTEHLKEYYEGENTKELNKGKYKVYYSPRWYGIEDDRNARVKIFVKSKDHPLSKATIKTNEIKITALKAEKSRLETTIAGLKSKITMLEEAIRTNTTAACNQKREKKCSEELEELIKNKKIRTRESEEIKLELNTYKNFCSLIKKIIEGLTLHEPSENELLERIFKQFIENFPELISY